jgi:hypothetical protein
MQVSLLLLQTLVLLKPVLNYLQLLTDYDIDYCAVEDYVRLCAMVYKSIKDLHEQSRVIVSFSNCLFVKQGSVDYFYDFVKQDGLEYCDIIELYDYDVDIGTIKTRLDRVLDKIGKDKEVWIITSPRKGFGEVCLEYLSFDNVKTVFFNNVISGKTKNHYYLGEYTATGLLDQDLNFTEYGIEYQFLQKYLTNYRRVIKLTQGLYKLIYDDKPSIYIAWPKDNTKEQIAAVLKQNFTSDYCYVVFNDQAKTILVKDLQLESSPIVLEER